MDFDFKEDIEVYTTEPHYDLFYGGYIKPEEMLASPADARAVNEAVSVVRDFLDQAEAAGVLLVG